jgi:sugar lactone lactonase YvrE
MGKAAQPRAGAIYRYFDGKLERLFPEITIPNAICFAPDGRRAYYADTPRQRIWTVALDAQGWPAAASEVFADLRGEAKYPDGAVVDAQGALWVAQWGAGRVVRYLRDGRAESHLSLFRGRRTGQDVCHERMGGAEGPRSSGRSNVRS